jgi:anionic cell wall polymer biosynthesis LytR-Cps2A-Psr (LCP) family protein
MTPPRDIWKEPPPLPFEPESEEDADGSTPPDSSGERPHLKAHASSAADEAIRRLAEHHVVPGVADDEVEDQIEDYTPRHHAEGRAPLFKRVRREEPEPEPEPEMEAADEEPPTSYEARHLAPKKRWFGASEIEQSDEPDEEVEADEPESVRFEEASSELQALVEGIETSAEVEVVEVGSEIGPPQIAPALVPVEPDALEMVESETEAAPIPPPPPRLPVSEVLEFEGEERDALDADTDADTDADDHDDDTDDDVDLDELSEGPRKAALRKRRRRQRLVKLGSTIILAAAVITAGVIAGARIKDAVDDNERSAKVAGGGAVANQEPITTLVFGTRETSRGQPVVASWMNLITVDPREDRGSIIYIPAHTAAEVPGRGLMALGDAYRSGGIPLLLVSAENFLGVPIDRYVELSDKDARVLFEATGPLTIDVPQEIRIPLRNSQTRIVMASGPQELGPQSLVKFLYLRGESQDDIDLASRHLAFWVSLLDAMDDPKDLARAVTSAGAALSESDATTEQHARFFQGLAALPRADVTITTLPVTPSSTGDSELYGTDADELSQFLAEVVGAKAAQDQIRVQLLNGNGVPGIGKDVAEELVGQGFRIILSGNAQRLNYRKTLIIAYDSSAEGLALAERAKELLGVGEVQVSQQSQGIVDLTIVVGKDYLRAH